ncbi:glucans biosynthesis glucosyltransferase MdoH [Alteromonas oceanisediminis]|uniref:glucans biosynthesis glucosyltransferase MdoH n=1 Tax=Alteromonas oceanisediminis TaxID=2836180 RepID=UPI001BD9176D|nr:glucans biosynthesis glucosyltransferase MdoH [Alteromonas oceanisediminis]MBT0585197.1 glucans biosynthesis glucosyltransferase MdoH [Alteromonas oceanisediminis]
MDALNKTLATPPEVPMAMPAQDFSQKPAVKYAGQGFKAFLARLITFGGATLLTAFACYQMILIVSEGNVTFLQWVMVGLFGLTFVWIALAACGAVSGLLLSKKSRGNSDMDISDTRTVLLMPVYNEDPSETCAALYSMGMALHDKGLGEQFELFIISDSRNPDVWVKETAAVDHLRQSLQGKINVWYRRRHDNRAKKAGNVHEFVTRWGGRYDYMIVLDADSLLSADTLNTLVAEMAHDPNSGIIQTLPCLYRGDTLFARLQQFAGSVYGPIVARGISAWQGNDGNYWGHNAIIRVSAFAESAGLPTLGGVKPFKGDILSHDFVEAALMRRAGWSVTMLPDVKGSWEESPPSLSDVAVRDRRWAQGNIQHLAVLKARGLRWPNRFHMLTGVMGYMASPFWLALIVVGIAMSVQIHYVDVEYFSDQMTLIPNWPLFDSERMIELFIMTMGVLLVPKVLGLLRAFFHRPLRKPLGVIRMTLSTLVEIFFSVLYAPIFMLIHCKHVFDIFRGRDSGWATQQRQSRGIPWKLVCRQHVWHTAIGVATTGLLYYYSPALLIWLSPTLAGLILAIPLAGLSGSKRFASGLKSLGILNIPEDVTECTEMQLRERYGKSLAQMIASVNIRTLLQDEAQQRAHFSLASKLPPAPRGEPHIHYLSACAKIDDADTSEEALSWLNNDEKLTILSDRQLFQGLAGKAQSA